jgi:zinc transporter ZupT
MRLTTRTLAPALLLVTFSCQCNAQSEEELRASELRSSIDLRIAAIFVTGAATLLGIVPLVAKAASNITPVVLLSMRAASAGTMLSLALVHILPEAVFATEDVTAFPLAGTRMALGVFVSYAIQMYCHHSHSISPPQPQSDAATPPKELEIGGGAVIIGMPPMWAALPSPGAFMMAPPPAMPLPTPGACTTPGTCSHAGASGASADKIVIRSSEFGVKLHSIFLGLALGVETERATLILLLVVLVFHQVLEGMCLGCLISRLPSRGERLLAMAVNSLSLPAGIIAGLLIAVFGDSTSDSIGPVAACLSSFAGGMVLYTTLVNPKPKSHTLNPKPRTPNPKP